MPVASTDSCAARQWDYESNSSVDSLYMHTPPYKVGTLVEAPLMRHLPQLMRHLVAAAATRNCGRGHLAWRQVTGGRSLVELQGCLQEMDCGFDSPDRFDSFGSPLQPKSLWQPVSQPAPSRKMMVFFLNISIRNWYKLLLVQLAVRERAVYKFTNILLYNICIYNIYIYTMYHSISYGYVLKLGTLWLPSCCLFSIIVSPASSGLNFSQSCRPSRELWVKAHPRPSPSFRYVCFQSVFTTSSTRNTWSRSNGSFLVGPQQASTIKVISRCGYGIGKDSRPILECSSGCTCPGCNCTRVRADVTSGLVTSVRAWGYVFLFWLWENHSYPVVHTIFILEIEFHDLSGKLSSTVGTSPKSQLRQAHHNQPAAAAVPPARKFWVFEPVVDDYHFSAELLKICQENIGKLSAKDTPNWFKVRNEFLL